MCVVLMSSGLPKDGARGNEHDKMGTCHTRMPRLEGSRVMSTRDDGGSNIPNGESEGKNCLPISLTLGPRTQLPAPILLFTEPSRMDCLSGPLNVNFANVSGESKQPMMIIHSPSWFGGSVAPAIGQSMRTSPRTAQRLNPAKGESSGRLNIGGPTTLNTRETAAPN